MTVKAATAKDAPKVVVPDAPDPVLVRPTPIQTAVREAMVRPDTDLPKNKYWRRATHGVVMIFASLIRYEQSPRFVYLVNLLIKPNRVVG